MWAKGKAKEKDRGRKDIEQKGKRRQGDKGHGQCKEHMLSEIGAAYRNRDRPENETVKGEIGT